MASRVADRRSVLGAQQNNKFRLIINFGKAGMKNTNQVIVVAPRTGKGSDARIIACLLGLLVVETQIGTRAIIFFDASVSGPATELAHVISSPLTMLIFGISSSFLFLAAGFPSKREFLTALVIFGGVMIGGVVGAATFIGMALIHAPYWVAILASVGCTFAGAITSIAFGLERDGS